MTTKPLWEKLMDFDRTREGVKMTEFERFYAYEEIARIHFEDKLKCPTKGITS